MEQACPGIYSAWHHEVSRLWWWWWVRCRAGLARISTPLFGTRLNVATAAPGERTRTVAGVAQTVCGLRLAFEERFALASLYFALLYSIPTQVSRFSSLL